MSSNRLTLADGCGDDDLFERHAQQSDLTYYGRNSQAEPRIRFGVALREHEISDAEFSIRDHPSRPASTFGNDDETTF
jgi:hypothetical protein